LINKFADTAAAGIDRIFFVEVMGKRVGILLRVEGGTSVVDAEICEWVPETNNNIDFNRQISKESFGNQIIEHLFVVRCRGQTDEACGNVVMQQSERL